MRPTSWIALFVLGSTGLGAEFPGFVRQEIDPAVGKVCYALTVADVDGDGKPDLVAASEAAVIAYTNPTWAKRDLIRGATKPDNVCIQAADVDGDGRVDFALGAGWQPSNTRDGGTIQLLTRTGAPATDAWRLVPIGSEPTTHRVRWGQPLGPGRPQLVVAPLQGRGTRGPDWGSGRGVRLMVCSPPDRLDDSPWPVELVDDTLHTVHNVQVVDLDDDGRPDIVAAAWEGVFKLSRADDGRWTKTQIGAGNQTATPFKGASEVKVGRLAGERKIIATIEPWHGSQVVVYTQPASGQGLWDRRVVDEPIGWGHAVWFANLDDDDSDELIIGQRDKSPDPARSPAGPGVFMYDPKPGDGPVAFDRRTIDDGGVAVEDLIAADFDGDGRVDIAAGGRATHNVVIYWNRPAASPR